VVLPTSGDIHWVDQVIAARAPREADKMPTCRASYFRRIQPASFTALLIATRSTSTTVKYLLEGVDVVLQRPLYSHANPAPYLFVVCASSERRQHSILLFVLFSVGPRSFTLTSGLVGDVATLSDRPKQYSVSHMITLATCCAKLPPRVRWGYSEASQPKLDRRPRVPPCLYNRLMRTSAGIN
jgi:hypothetical protein